MKVHDSEKQLSGRVSRVAGLLAGVHISLASVGTAYAAVPTVPLTCAIESPSVDCVATPGRCSAVGIIANFANPLPALNKNCQPDTRTTSTSAVFVSGGSKIIINGVERTAATDGSPIYFSIGAPFASTVPFSDFQSVYNKNARLKLYGEGATLDADKTAAAFRYKNDLYDAGKTMLAPKIEPKWTQVQKDRLSNAITELKSALRVDPSNTALRNTLLDALYDKAVVNLLLAKEQEESAIKATLSLPSYVALPPATAIDKEIEYLEKALKPYEEASQEYFSLFSDRMGVALPSVIDSAPETENSTFGYHVFVREVPRRALTAALDVDGKPVISSGTDANGKPVPAVIVSGYKDLVLLIEILRDRARLAAKLAKAYAVKGQSWRVLSVTDPSIQKARALVGSQLRDIHAARTVLEGIYPNLVVDNSGLPEARAGLKIALAQLSQAKAFIDSGNNPLGVPDDFLVLVKTTTGDSYNFFERLLIPGQSATGTSGPLSNAMSKYDAAAAAYNNLGANQDRFKTELEGFQAQYGDRLRAIVGCPPPGSPVSTTPVGCVAYDKPTANSGGQIFAQIQAVKRAANLIARNTQQSKNLELEIQYEIERRNGRGDVNAQMQSMYIRYVDKQADLTIEISRISAAQAAASALAQGANSWLTSFGASTVIGVGNALLQTWGETEKGRHQAEKERLQAQQSADIVGFGDQLEGIDSSARVKTLMLNRAILLIDSMDALSVQLEELGKLDALLQEKAYTEARWEESKSSLASRYFADPAHRLVVVKELEAADREFKVAQFWVYAMARAMEYRWVKTAVLSDGQRATDAVLRMRNAKELVDLAVTLTQHNLAKDVSLRIVSCSDKDRDNDSTYSTVSLRRDIFGIRDGVSYYDEASGQMLDHAAKFNAMVLGSPIENCPSGGPCRVFRFNLARPNPELTFFSPTRWAEKNNWIGVRVSHAGLKQTTMPVHLALTGGGFVRTETQDIVDDSVSPPIEKGGLERFPAVLWRVDPVTGQVRLSELPSEQVAAEVVTDNRRPVTSNRTTYFRELAPAADWTLYVPVADDTGTPLFGRDPRTNTPLKRVLDIELAFDNCFSAPRERPSPTTP